jgi:chromosome segregation ATPase
LGRNAKQGISSAEAPRESSSKSELTRQKSLADTISDTDTADARAKFNEVNKELSNLRNDLRQTREHLEKLDTNFGPQAEWKKLDGTCVEKEQSGYVPIAVVDLQRCANGKCFM